MNKYFYQASLLCLLANFAAAQQPPTLINDLVFNLTHHNGGLGALQIMECNPDSTHGYGFLSATDSVLFYRQLRIKYGTTAMTVRTYDDNAAQLLTRVDSTVFDGMGRRLFKQLWEYDSDAGALITTERQFFYPHGDVVPNPCFGSIFDETLNDIFCNLNGEANQNDSVITHTLDFFSGTLMPSTKNVSIFSPISGELIETQVYSFDQFGTMDWYQTRKSLYTYGTDGKLNQVDDYDWNGLDFMLATSNVFAYNADNSLQSFTATNMATNTPDQKLEYIYDPVANSTKAIINGWDPATNGWIPSISVLADLDAQDRLERVETVIDLFGFVDGGSFEYQYIGNSSCPAYSNLYSYTGSATWEFVGKYFYFPSVVSDINEQPQPLDWTAYPNPTSDGLWVEAPAGAPIQLSDMQGRSLFRGIAQGRQYIRLEGGNNRHLVLTVGQGKDAVSRLVMVQR